MCIVLTQRAPYIGFIGWPLMLAVTQTPVSELLKPEKLPYPPGTALRLLRDPAPSWWSRSAVDIVPLRFGLEEEQMIEFEPTRWRSEFVWFVAALLAMSIISAITLKMFSS